MVVSIFANLIMSGVMSKFIGAVRPLQLITHLLMLKIIVPANVMVFMEAILPITQHDYLEPYWTNFVIKIFRIEEEEQQLQIFGGNQEITDQILTLGYENQLSLLCLGSVSLYLILYLLKVIKFVALRHRYESVAKQHDAVFFKDLTGILTESFLELLITGYISVYQINKETFIHKIKFRNYYKKWSKQTFKHI